MIRHAGKKFLTRLGLFPSTPKRRLLGCCPVWGLPLSERLRAIEVVNAVNIAFGFPEYNNTLGWGPQQQPDQAETTRALLDLRARKIPVLISIGGENCTRNDWENITDPLAFAWNVKKFVDEWQMSGVDVQYDIYENDHAPVIPLLRALRTALPAPGYLLTYSAALQIGTEEKVIREAGGNLDWINARCYLTNSYPEYDPEEMVTRYRMALGNGRRVLFGFRLTDHPGEPRMSADDARRFAEFVVENDLGGVMLWNLSDPKAPLFLETIAPVLLDD